jgi:transposase-like protein
MKIIITLHCPNCQSAKIKIKKKGKKQRGQQNYLCKECGRQFIGDHALKYKGSHSSLIKRILMMPVRGAGIRDIPAIESISIKKALSVLVKSSYKIQPKQNHYEQLDVDEFWTYA